ncbi:nicotinate-nicotinamide nucleotide adenylyltransferase [Sphingobacterium sp. E70]|uniref:nicotinate-nicotinamide nucleotide adenylyltransferase n=1 Tax=Sphingobacterium sp. E70 TaxID=2853439 RepID=UPI00359C2ADA
MKKIGLFFGSFNPVHVGHLIIANYMANFTGLDEVWFVVSPQNPFKKKIYLSGPLRSFRDVKSGSGRL